jgi:hypothetical protein
MHQGEYENFEGGAEEKAGPEFIEEDLSKIMVYGHSAMCSNGVVRPLEDYISILRSDKFYLYTDIYSLKKSSQYLVHICILDYNQVIPDVEKNLYFESLGPEFQTWLKSYLMVFEPNFKRSILNFPPEKISLAHFYETIRLWLPPVAKEEKNGEGV